MSDKYVRLIDDQDQAKQIAVDLVDDETPFSFDRTKTGYQFSVDRELAAGLDDVFPID